MLDTNFLLYCFINQANISFRYKKSKKVNVVSMPTISFAFNSFPPNKSILERFVKKIILGCKVIFPAEKWHVRNSCPVQILFILNTGISRKNSIIKIKLRYWIPTKNMNSYSFTLEEKNNINIIICTTIELQIIFYIEFVWKKSRHDM